MKTKVLIIALPILVGLAACNNPGDKDTKVSPHKNIRFETEPQNKSTEMSIDAQNTKQANSAASAIMKNDIQRLMQWLDESHYIFAESWKVIWDAPRSQSYSVFKQLKALLGSKFSQSGVSYRAMSPCEGLKVAWPKNLPSQPEGKEAQYTAEMFMQNCQTNLKDSIAKIKIRGDKAFQLEISPANLRRGVGDALAILNQTIICEMAGNSQGQLELLKCSKLGQSWDHEKYLEMEKFEYSRKNNKTLHVVGSKFRALQDKESDFDLLVPIQGNIIYQEKEVPSEDKANEPSNTETEPVIEFPMEARSKGSESSELSGPPGKEVGAQAADPESFELGVAQ